MASERQFIPRYKTYFDAEDTLKNLKERVERLIEEYGEEAYVDKEYDKYSHDDSYTLVVYLKEPENDKEYATRLATEEKWRIQREEQEKNQYEALKKKFG